MSKIDTKLFNAHEQALEDHGNCPQCDNKLQLKHSKHGAFLGCSAYPSCEYMQPLQPQESSIKQILAGTNCPECGNELALKQSKYGLFVGCTNFPQCNYIAKLNEPEQTTTTNCTCPICKTGEMVERQSKFGKTFYACNQYPKCSFAVNYPPQQGACQYCGFELLLERNFAIGKNLICAKKSCSKKQP